MYNTLFFDLDGTITDSELAIINAFRYALAEQFSIKENNTENLMGIIGVNLAEAFITCSGCTKDEAMKAIAKYREYYEKNGTIETTVYEGMPQLLSNLKKEGKTLIIATSKPTPVAEKVLKHFNLMQYFDFISGSNLEGTRNKKSEVIQYAIDECKLNNKSSMVMIGDTKFDIEGAREIGIDSIGVKYGVGTEDELKDATFVVDSVKSLDILLKKPSRKISINATFSRGLEF